MTRLMWTLRTMTGVDEDLSVRILIEGRAEKSTIQALSRIVTFIEARLGAPIGGSKEAAP